MNSADLFTARLRLVTLSRQKMRADFASRSKQLSRLLHADVPSCWPPEHWEPHCFAFIETMYANHPHTYGWSRYVVRRGSPDVLVGTVGAFPRTPRETEIGYGILPPWQRHGYATEAAQALISHLWQERSIATISAQTFTHLVGSIRVMERCGMREAGLGDEPGTVRYELARD